MSSSWDDWYVISLIKNILHNLFFNEERKSWGYLKKRKSINFIFFLIIFTIIWVIYYFQAFQLFSEVKEFATEDASYIVRLLEFTNFRGEELSLIFIEYFILISACNILSLFIYKKIAYNNKKTLLGILMTIIVLLVSVMCVISGIFWSVYLLLTILSALVVLAAVQIAGVIWGSSDEYNEGDVVFHSEGFKSEKLAQNSLNKKIEQINSKNISNLSTEIFQIEDEYFFEIYAKDKIILDKKGEFIINEEI